MGIFSKLIGEENGHKSASAADAFIDLTDYREETPMADASTSTYVKVAELQRYEDLRDFVPYVYEGNILIIDFGMIAKDEIALRRLTADLKKLAKDVGGDLAGLGEHTLIVTPGGIRIDRRKMKASQG